MKYRVSLGVTLNIGNFSSVRAEVSSESDIYIEAFEESRTKLFDAAYHIAKEVSGGLNANSQYVNIESTRAVDFLATKLIEEPRI